jgi:hypothetical protein
MVADTMKKVVSIILVLESNNLKAGPSAAGVGCMIFEYETPQVNDTPKQLY